MKYYVTYITPTTYCHVQPTDPECQRTQIIQADNKIAAVNKLHTEYGFWREKLTTKVKGNSAHNLLPVVWEIKESP